MSSTKIADAVFEAGILLRADGADLHLIDFDAENGRVRVAVDISGSNCPECIIPPDLLAEMLTDVINRNYSSVVEVDVDDPRRDEPILGGH